jgi:hypothetical protein
MKRCFACAILATVLRRALHEMLENKPQMLKALELTMRCRLLAGSG